MTKEERKEIEDCLFNRQHSPDKVDAWMAYQLFMELEKAEEEIENLKELCSR